MVPGFRAGPADGRVSVKVLEVILAKDWRGMQQFLDGQKARPVNRAWRGDGVGDLLEEA